MTFEEAKLYLLMNGSGTWNEHGDPLVQDDGFLGCLRPYQGLDDDNFHNVMEALFVACHHFDESSSVDKDLVSSIWYMCYLARLWGTDPKGMLQRNNLITTRDVARLANWIDVIEYSALQLLGSNNWSEAINTYAGYVCEYGAGSNAKSFVPLFVSAIDDNTERDPSTIARALGKMGPLASDAVPTLKKAASQTYRVAEPVDRVTTEIQTTIREAIARIDLQ